MIYKFKYISIFVTSVIFFSCRPDPPPPDPDPTTGTLKIHFTLNWNGQPFSFFTPYTDANFNYQIQTELLKFISYKLTVKNSAGTESMIEEAHIINFTTDQFSYTVNLEQGNYQGLKFGIGVGDSATNHGDPAVFPSTHALSYNQAADLHWTWNTGYIFLKFEGRADTTGTGSGSLDQLYTLHTGDDPLYGEVNFYANPFMITAEQTTDFYIDVDVSKFLYNATDTIDIKTENSTHTNNNLAIKFSQIYLDAFSAQ